ncbi:MAG: peptidoglycan DD-metalloendopeptidase family protein [Solirubrobacteraceae bacterium]
MRLPVAALAVLLTAPADAAAAAWSPPVDGPVARAFDLGPDPFEAGRHRGIDLAAPPGTSVRAPCAGPVAVAGRVGTSGGVVTLRCGPWRVSHMPLATIAVRPGDAVRPGALLGTLDVSRAHAGLHLGVRRHGTRFGYVDPARFLATTGLPPPLVPGTSPRVRAGPPRLGPAPRPALVPRPASGPVVAPRPASDPVFAPRAASGPVVAPRPASDPVFAPRAASGPVVAPPGFAAEPRPGLRVGSNPAGGGGVAPWPAWAGLALVLAALGSRLPRRPRVAWGRLATAGTVIRMSRSIDRR